MEKEKAELVSVPTGTACGPLLVHVQKEEGADVTAKTIFVTVHDMGTNHTAFVEFVRHQCMAEVHRWSVFVHVVLPGQEDEAVDMTGLSYPTLDELAEGVGAAMGALGYRLFVGLGEGVGANILCRLAMQQPHLVLGLVMLHCTSTQAGFLEKFKDWTVERQLRTAAGGYLQMSSGAYQYLAFHRFGDPNSHRMDEMHHLLNPRNLAKLLDSFCHRTDLSKKLREQMNTDTLLVAGSKASHLHTVRTMYAAMDPRKTSLILLPNVADCLTESPAALQQAILLFCKGLGTLVPVPLPELDQPPPAGQHHHTMGQDDRSSYRLPPSM